MLWFVKTRLCFAPASVSQVTHVEKLPSLDQLHEAVELGFAERRSWLDLPPQQCPGLSTQKYINTSLTVLKNVIAQRECMEGQVRCAAGVCDLSAVCRCVPALLLVSQHAAAGRARCGPLVKCRLAWHVQAGGAGESAGRGLRAAPAEGHAAPAPPSPVPPELEQVRGIAVDRCGAH